jgi:tetratricopeptide (TPR) repeat protein
MHAALSAAACCMIAMQGGPARAAATAPAQAIQTQATPAQASAQAPATPEQLGDTYMLHQRYQEAINAYKKAPRDSPDAWNKMGIAYQMMFNLDQATRCYKMSLKLNPNNAHVLNNLGTIYDSLKELRQAERMYRRALKADPQSAITYKNLGTNLLAQQKYSKGWDAYKAALALDPNIFANSSTLRVQAGASLEERGALNYYMARGCARAGQTDCAIEYLRLALTEGYTTAKKLAADTDFASLHGAPAFQQLLATQGYHGKL